MQVEGVRVTGFEAQYGVARRVDFVDGTGVEDEIGEHAVVEAVSTVGSVVKRASSFAEGDDAGAGF